jgi:ketosteroid isomerase-like protein
MSRENVEIVKRAIAAVNDRDVDRHLACCTENIQLQTPWADIEGVYEGPHAIRRFFADIEDTQPDFRLEVERLDSIGTDRVLVFLRASASGRAMGIGAADLPTANVYNLADGKIKRIRIFVDRDQAREAAGLKE